MHECRIRDLNSLIQGFSTYWYTVYPYLARCNVLRPFCTKWGTGGLAVNAAGLSRPNCSVRPMRMGRTHRAHPFFWSELLICVYGKTRRAKVMGLWQNHSIEVGRSRLTAGERVFTWALHLPCHSFSLSPIFLITGARTFMFVFGLFLFLLQESFLH